MPLEFGKSTFKEVTSNLELVEKWLNGKGVNTKDTRFETIKKNVFEISIYQEQGKTSEIINRLGMETVVASLIEAAPFIDIYNAFKGLNSRYVIPDRDLKSIVAGSFLSKDEDRATNQARNILFQLELAALLKSKGIEIINFDDVSFELEGAIWNVQCKRPMSVKRLRENVQKAKCQAQTFFSKTVTELESRGIIALAIDKIFGFDRNTIVTPTSVSLENYIKMRSMEFINQFQHEWRGIIDTRFLAVFVYLRAITDVKENGVLSIVKYTTVVELTTNSLVQARDNFRLKALEMALTAHL